jgi:hypothetical protein
MKSSNKIADEMRNLLRRLSRDGKPQTMTPLEPLMALVRGAMSYDVADGRAEDAMAMISKEFVDLNELRVATDLEIQGLLGVKYPEIKVRVAMITLALNSIFEREHTMSLERPKTLSTRDARQFLRELPEIHPFVEAFIMLSSFDGTAMPIDDMMLSFLKTQKAVADTATLDEAQRFLEHHLKAEEIYEAFRLIRRAASDASDGPEKGRRRGQTG